MNANALLRWYAPRAGAYPWRGADPWGVLVSEVMLQQTQAERVRPHYERFVARFPAPRALASAGAGAAITAWAGLGYNRRAVNLYRAAVTIERYQGGRVPSDVAALRGLPGVGPYTAAAVACFAYGADVAVVETNVRRVVARHRLGLEPRDAAEPDVAAAAADLVPEGRARDWNQALMDLARDVCRSRPRCDACPVAGGCLYRAAARTPVAAPNGRRQARFEGSRRQARGRIVALLRERGCVTLRAAASAAGIDDASAAQLVAALADEGLCVPSPAARAGRGRGLVRLP